MKVINLQFNSIEELNKNLDITKYNYANTFIQVFSGFIKKDEVTNIRNILTSQNPLIQFIGTTTAGEIHNNDVYEKSIVVSIMIFNSTTFTSSFFDDKDAFKIGIKIANNLLIDNTKAMIIFCDGTLTNANDVLNGISSINTNIPIAGGIAGDNSNYKQTFVFTNKEISNKGVVAVSFQSITLNVFTNYHLNWKSIGKKMIVTKAEKNRLYEIDNIPVSQIYKKYLGEEIYNNIDEYGIIFPFLLIKDNDVEICRRAKISIPEDGSIITYGNIDVGDTITLSFGNIESIINDMKNDLDYYKKFNPEAIFAYNCNGRKSFLKSKINSELIPLSKIAPLCGFFSYGEIYNSNQNNTFLNLTLTTLSLYERDKNYKKSTTDYNNLENILIKDKNSIICNALTHLVNTITDELLQDNQELKLSQYKLKEEINIDFLSKLYNRRYFDFISKDVINIAKRENKEFSILMIDIDKFKLVNDDYGHIVGDEVIKKLSYLLLEHTRHSDIVSRIGGEEFAIILPFTTKEGAYKMAEELRQSVEKYSLIFNNLYIKFTISIGIDSLNLKDDTDISETLNRADKALYMAKEQGRNKVVIYPKE